MKSIIVSLGLNACYNGRPVISPRAVISAPTLTLWVYCPIKLQPDVQRQRRKDRECVSEWAEAEQESWQTVS